MPVTSRNFFRAWVQAHIWRVKVVAFNSYWPIGTIMDELKQVFTQLKISFSVSRRVKNLYTVLVTCLDSTTLWDLLNASLVLCTRFMILGHPFKWKSEGRLPPAENQTSVILCRMVLGSFHLAFNHAHQESDWKMCSMRSMQDPTVKLTHATFRGF